MRPQWLQNLINNFKHLPWALAAVIFYRYPAKKLKVIGVTGTDGKTTTATLIYEIFKKANLKVALISTVAAKIGNQDLDTGLHVTSPNPWELQRLLRLIADKGFQYVVIEATSHGLDQYRLLGCNFYLGVFTNLTWEHLDYHRTIDNYLQAKAKLFTFVKISILNKDDKFFSKLAQTAGGKVVTYGLKRGDFTPQNFPFKTKLLGSYNISNCLAAIAATNTIGIKPTIIKETLVNFKGVVGRMEEIKVAKQNFRAIVDFAHTPNGLENALKTLQQIHHKKLIAVFGCAGLRDFRKRPMMGKIACRLADKIILTAEDPRTEDVHKIIRQIIAGCENKDKVVVEPDRKKAIDLAIAKLASKEDIVGIFGKGHEKSLCFGTKEYPWSDQEAVLAALKRRFKI